MPKISPWGAGVLKYLGDGHWHARKEVIEACRVLVPPDHAVSVRDQRIAWYRNWRDQHQRSRGRERPIDHDEQVAVGSRNIIAAIIISMTRSGTLIRRGPLTTEELKLSAKGMLHYAYLLKGKSLGVGGGKPQPHNLAMLKYLLRGGDEWYARHLVMAAGAKLIPPARAVRVRDRDWKRQNEAKLSIHKRTLAQKIIVGNHTLCWSGLKSLVRHGMIERRDDADGKIWLRITAKGRMKYGPVAQADERRDPNAEAGGSSPPGPAIPVRVVPPSRSREEEQLKSMLKAMRHDEDTAAKNG